MPAPLKVGIVGLGRAGQVHLRSLLRIQKMHGLVDVRQVASNIPQEKEVLVNTFGLDASKFSNDFQEVVDNKELDVIVSAGATDTHQPTNIQVLRQGRHLFAEKPCALSLKDIKELRDLANENIKKGKMSAVNYHRRYHNNFARMKDMVMEGKVGTVEMINMVARDPTEPHEIYIPASGGLFKDMSVHDIDMARYISQSEIKNVYCQGGNLYSEMIERNGDCDSGTISFTFKSGVLGTLHITRRAKSGYDQRLEVYGSEGTLRNNNNGYNDVEYWNEHSISKDLGKYMFPAYYEEAFHDCMLNFV